MVPKVFEPLKFDCIFILACLRVNGCFMEPAKELTLNAHVTMFLENVLYAAYHDHAVSTSDHHLSSYSGLYLKLMGRV